MSRLLRTLSAIGGPAGAQLAARLLREARGEEHCVRFVRRRGLQLLLTPSDNLQRTILNTGTYDEPSLCMLESNLEVGDVVLDVGANIGWFSLTAGAVLSRLGGGQVIAVEPASDTFEVLTRHLQLNDLDSVVLPIRSALGQALGEVQLRASDRFGPSDVGTRTLHSSGAIVESVPQVRGDSLLSDLSIQSPDIVKIDVEGAELGVLRGLENIISDGCGPRLFIIEILDPRDSMEIFEWFEMRGYEHRRIMVDAFHIRERLEHSRHPNRSGNYAFYRHRIGA